MMTNTRAVQRQQLQSSLSNRGVVSRCSEIRRPVVVSKAKQGNRRTTFVQHAYSSQRNEGEIRNVKCKAGQRILRSPWEPTQKHELSKFGKLYKNILSGPLKYSPLLIATFAFIPLVHSYVLLAALESIGVNITSAIASLNIPFMDSSVGFKLGYFIKWALELPPSAAKEEVVKVLLQSVMLFVPWIYFVIVIPLGDIILGRDNVRSAVKKESGTAGYHLLLWTFGTMYAMLFSMSAIISSSLKVLPLLGVILSLGLYGSICITVSHELLHSTKRSERILAQSLLALVSYMHWFKAHTHVHHVRVATYEDPSSSRRDETVYEFLPRSIFGNIIEAYKIEKSNMARFLWSSVPVMIAMTLFVSLGMQSVIVYLGSSLTAIVLLEIVNYIEHYGLTRKKLPDGRYEAVTMMHSWNADWLFSNCHIIDLQLHADHHLHSSKPFYDLQNIEDAPQMPAPYPIMIVLALIPPLFFRIMNPRIDELQRA